MTDDAIALGPTKSDHVWTYAIFGFGGLLLFGAAPWLACWLDGVPFIPFHRALEWVGGLSATGVGLLRPAVGFVVGLVIAALIIASEYHLEVGKEELVIVHGNDRRTIRRDQIVGIHTQGKRVQIDGESGRVILKEEIDAPKDAVRSAFVTRGYPFESS